MTIALLPTTRTVPFAWIAPGRRIRTRDGAPSTQETSPERPPPRRMRTSLAASTKRLPLPATGAGAVSEIPARSARRATSSASSAPVVPAARWTWRTSSLPDSASTISTSTRWLLSVPSAPEKRSWTMPWAAARGPAARRRMRKPRTRERVCMVELFDTERGGIDVDARRMGIFPERAVGRSQEASLVGPDRPRREKSRPRPGARSPGSGADDGSAAPGQTSIRRKSSTTPPLR